MATNQRDIFNQFKAVSNAESLPPYESPVSQSMDNMDMVDFLFEMVKQTKGQEGTKNLILKSTLGELNGSVNVNTSIANIIKSTFFCLFDVTIPAKLTEGQEGIIFNLNEVDPLNTLSVDPDSPEGKHLYDSNDSTKSLNCLMYSALSATDETNPVLYQKNIGGVKKTLFSVNSLTKNQMQLHIGSSYANQNLSVWAEDYLQDMTFFNMPNFIAQLVDIMTGAVSVKVGKGEESAKDNAKMQKAMKKLFGFCKNNSPSGDNTNADNTINEEGGQTQPSNNISPNQFLKDQENKNNVSYDNLFDFTPEELLDIQDIANLHSQGKIRFSTCGNFEVAVDPDAIFKKMDELFIDAVDDSTDPPTYNNQDIVPNIDNTANFLTSIISGSVTPTANQINNTVGNADGSTNANNLTVNLPNMEAEFELGTIKSIPYALSQSIISPQLLSLIKVSSNVIGENKNTDVFTLESVIKDLSKIITQIGDDIWNNIIKNIFNILKRELMELLSGLVTKYLSQRFSDYIGIITYLTNLLKGIDFGGKNCQGILDAIMQLLSLTSFGPSLPIPPPLVYFGGMLKPGLNQVSVVNSLKSNLSNKGIEVGATFSDGTPNYLMAALEETVNTMVTSLKMDANIQVMTMTGPIPSIGYAQIT